MCASTIGTCHRRVCTGRLRVGNVPCDMTTNTALDDLIGQARLRRELPEPGRRRYLRERAAISQGALADAVGVRTSAISRWESGKRQPRPGRALAAYVEALGRLAALA